ncbi:unnamed protein product, partial [Meganyctiphanes norvegica]
CLPSWGHSSANLLLTIREPKYRPLQYALVLTQVPNLTEFTICLRFQLLSMERSHFLLTYAATGTDNTIVVYVSPNRNSGVGFYVNNVRVKAKVKIQPKTW